MMKCGRWNFAGLIVTVMLAGGALGQEPRDADRPPPRVDPPRDAVPRDDPPRDDGSRFGEPREDGRRGQPGGPPGRRGENAPGRRPADGQGPGFDPFGGPPGPGGPPGMRPGRPPFRGPQMGGDPFGPALADPEMADLMRQDAELEEQTRAQVQRIEEITRVTTKAEAAKRSKALIEELKETVAKHFEVRQKRRELQIQRLEEELKRLQEAVAKRNESRDEIIKKRLTELLGPTDDLEF